MDKKKLWQKISGSITFYLKDYDREKSNEELLEDYLDYVLPDDIEDDGVRRYLDKQTFEFIEFSDEIVEKAINAFKERLKKKREKEAPKEIDKNLNKNKEIETKKAEVIDFNRYKKL